MVIAFLCLVLAVASGSWLLCFALDMRSVFFGFCFAMIGGFIAVIGTVAALAYGIAAYSWIASDHQARIINREYGTNYTREEVFYASSVIETIRELDRKRVEVNGDLFREESK